MLTIITWRTFTNHEFKKSSSEFSNFKEQEGRRIGLRRNLAQIYKNLQMNRRKDDDG